MDAAGHAAKAATIPDHEIADLIDLAYDSMVAGADPESRVSEEVGAEARKAHDALVAEGIRRGLID